MKADKIKVKVKRIFKMLIVKVVLKINVKKGNVKFVVGFLKMRIIKKCTVIDLIDAVWKIFRFAIKILSLYSFLNHIE
jgi:hypothetical protein